MCRQLASRASERGFGAVEPDLNALVYQLYGLSEAEIALVEEASH